MGTTNLRWWCFKLPWATVQELVQNLFIEKLWFRELTFLICPVRNLRPWAGQKLIGWKVFTNLIPAVRTHPERIVQAIRACIMQTLILHNSVHTLMTLPRVSLCIHCFPYSCNFPCTGWGGGSYRLAWRGRATLYVQLKGVAGVCISHEKKMNGYHQS